MAEPNSNIVVEVEKWIDENDNYEPKVTVVRVWALKREHLPIEYTRTYPNCVMNDYHDRKIIVEKKRHTDAQIDTYELVEGKTYSKNSFDMTVKDIQQCANRLHDLERLKKNQIEKNKRIYNDWVGKRIIKIQDSLGTKKDRHGVKHD